MLVWTAIGIFYYRLHNPVLALTAAEDGPWWIGRPESVCLGVEHCRNGSAGVATPINGVPAKPALATSDVKPVM
jgi:hypothetical protein